MFCFPMLSNFLTKLSLFSDWNGAVIAFMLLGLLFHLIAFIFAIVAACRKGHPFPSFLVAGLFLTAGNFVEDSL